MHEIILNFLKNQVMGINTPVNTINLLEIIVISLLLSGVYLKYIRKTPYEKLLNAVLAIISMLLLGKFFIILKLQIIGKFFETLSLVAGFALVVVFQPELRKFFGHISQSSGFAKNTASLGAESNFKNAINEIAEAVKYLSKAHIGALIVLQNADNIHSYSEVGVQLNADLSTELLLTIFHPNTALHDGAIVIQNDKILSAGVLLPLTEDPKLSWQYGTRHRAALGLSEVSDAVCVVVSEETGSISIARNGVLAKYNTPDELKVELQMLFGFLSKNNEFENIVDY